MQEAFAGELAYTTLMTTLDRLFRKGLLARRKEGRAYVYSARVSHGELRQGAARGLLSRLLGADRESARPILSSIVESVSERDRELLDDLERLVQDRRRALAEGGGGVSELLKGLALGLVSFLAVSVVASVLAPALARPWLEPRAGGTAGAGRGRSSPCASSLPPPRCSPSSRSSCPPTWPTSPAGATRRSAFPCWPWRCSPGSCWSRRRCAACGPGAGRAGSRGPGRRARSPWTSAFAGLPAYRITHPFPVVAVLGVRHPRLYVASQVLSELRRTPSWRPCSSTSAPTSPLATTSGTGSCAPAPTSSPGRPPAGGSIARGWPPRRRRPTSVRRAGGPGRRSSWPRRSSGWPDWRRRRAPRSLPELALHNGDDLARRVRRLADAPAPPSDPPSRGPAAGRPASARGAALLPGRPARRARPHRVPARPPELSLNY